MTVRHLLVGTLLAAVTCASFAAAPFDPAFGRQGVSSMRLPDLNVEMPFSFRMGGKSFHGDLSGWSTKRTVRRLDAHRSQVVVTRIDHATNIEVKLVGVVYQDYPAVEWTVTLKNLGKTDSPIIEDLQAIDSVWERRTGTEFVLHHNVGSPANQSDYGPIETPLPAGVSKRVGAAGGRPTNSDMSYFNISEGNRGTIFVVGWPGQWVADFVREGDKGLKIRAGQERTHFKLHSGEEVRTPLIVLLDWKGDWIDGQNEWRRWMTDYGMPKPGGKLPPPMIVASSSRAYEEMIGGNEANQIMHIDRYAEEKLGLAYWWMDAGWYIQDHGWPQVGTWEVDRKRFPHGFLPISQHAHSKGMKTLVWFEPERVAPDTWLAQNHPEWLLNPLSSLVALRSSKLGTGEPCVVSNQSDRRLDVNGIHWNAGQLSFHPGPKGEYGVVRWTAPKRGKFKVDAQFEGIDDQTTTDVHVLTGGKELFGSAINLNGQGRSCSYAGELDLAAGQSIDFVVGYGNGSYTYDSTGIEVNLVGDDGVTHRAGKEFQSGRWSYGYLRPGSKPDSSTFEAFDISQRGGASGNQLLNLGNDEARKWLTEHIDKLIRDNQIGLYRQDFNFDPLIYWQSNDAPDRQGITENKHVVGYLAYWDELRRRHPDMLIDSCASGGRRNDLETMRRSVPLWRSDYAYEAVGHQCMTYGISMWLPFHGTGTVASASASYYGGGLTKIEPYAFWSNVAPSLGFGIDIRERGIDYQTLRRLDSDRRKVAEYFYGDYYPLTPYSLSADVWIAWQFAGKDQQGGAVLAFRRQGDTGDRVHLVLRGLNPKASYRFTALEGGSQSVLESKEHSGAELMGAGIELSVLERPGTAILTYHQVK